MKEKTLQVAFRLPEWLVKEIDEFAEEHSKKEGFEMNRTQAVYKLILRGLGERRAEIMVKRLLQAYEQLDTFTPDQLLNGYNRDSNVTAAAQGLEIAVETLSEIFEIDPKLIPNHRLADLIDKYGKLLDKLHDRTEKR